MRISSEGLQKRSFVVGAPLLEDETPERLALYMPDGTPIDLDPDPSKMRWRGTWSDVETTYALHDVVSFSGGLYIFMGDEAPLAGILPIATGSAWVNMASSSALRFAGEWAPGAFLINDVVTHDDKLWVAQENINLVEFSHVGTSEGSSDAPGPFSLAVPAGTEVGDLLVWAAVVTSFSSWPKPSEGSWITVLETPLEAVTFPSGRMAVYAKLAEEDDLGTDKTYTLPTSVTVVGQLRAFTGAAVPIPAETDVALVAGDSYGTPATASAGSDPAETELADKVLRVFGVVSQNFSYDSGNLPAWEASSDDQDVLITDSHNWVDIGSYWAEPVVSNPPDFSALSGEHRRIAAAKIRLPSPFAWDESKWIQIAVVHVDFTEVESRLDDLEDTRLRWLGPYDADTVYVKSDMISFEDGIWVAPGPIFNLEPGGEPDNADLFTNRAVVIKESDRFDSLEPVTFTIDSVEGRDNDIGAGLGAVIYLDKSGSLASGTTLTIIPVDHVSGDRSLSASTYHADGTYRPLASGTLDQSQVNAHTPLVLDIDDEGSTDMVVHIFYDSGVDGHFTAELNHNTNLNPPPNYIDAWELLVQSAGETTGFKGVWVEDTVYPPGSIVKHDGSLWGTEEPTDYEPGVPAGSDFESVYVGLQATTLNKLEDGVARTFTWPDDAEVDSGGSLSIPIGIEFVGSLANLNLHLVNALDSTVTWLVDGSSAFGGGPYQSDQGATQDRFMNVGTYYGGTGRYVLTARADSDAVGTLTITATGAELVPPDLPNPWVDLLL